MEEDYFALLAAHQGYLERVALAMLGNWADAEDTLQEATLAGYLHYGELCGGPAAFPKLVAGGEAAGQTDQARLGSVVGSA